MEGERREQKEHLLTAFQKCKNYPIFSRWWMAGPGKLETDHLSLLFGKRGLETQISDDENGLPVHTTTGGNVITLGKNPGCFSRTYNNSTDYIPMEGRVPGAVPLHCPSSFLFLLGHFLPLYLPSGGGTGCCMNTAGEDIISQSSTIWAWQCSDTVNYKYFMLGVEYTTRQDSIAK